MTTVTRDYTSAPKGKTYQCQVGDAAGRCIRDATVKISNADANGGEDMSKLACPQHTDRAFQEVGAMSPAGSPEFRVIPVGSLAGRLRMLVPVYIA